MYMYMYAEMETEINSSQKSFEETNHTTFCQNQLRGETYMYKMAFAECEFARRWIFQAPHMSFDPDSINILFSDLRPTVQSM